MKTKLTLFVAVLASVLFGMGCVAPIESATGILFPETRKANKQHLNESEEGNFGRVKPLPKDFKSLKALAEKGDADAQAALGHA